MKLQHLLLFLFVSAVQVWTANVEANCPSQVNAVVFIHGIGGSADSFDKFPELIATDADLQHSMVVAQTFDYSNLTGKLVGLEVNIEEINRWKIERIAGLFAQHLKAVKLGGLINWSADCANSPPSVREIFVVAHSMGGLIARSYMAGMAYNQDSPECDPRFSSCSITPVPYTGEIGKLMTISTPHYGSESADTTWGVSSGVGLLSDVQLAQMRFGSQFIYDLHQNWAHSNFGNTEFLFVKGVAGFGPGINGDSIVSYASSTLPKFYEFNSKYQSRYVQGVHFGLAKIDDRSELLYKQASTFFRGHQVPELSPTFVPFKSLLTVRPKTISCNGDTRVPMLSSFVSDKTNLRLTGIDGYSKIYESTHGEFSQRSSYPTYWPIDIPSGESELHIDYYDGDRMLTNGAPFSLDTDTSISLSLFPLVAGYPELHSPLLTDGITCLRSPKDISLQTTDLEFIWEPIPGADWYLFELSKNGVVASEKWLRAEDIGCLTNTFGCRYTTQSPVSGNVQWRVQTWFNGDFEGILGPWSDYASFEFAITEPKFNDNETEIASGDKISWIANGAPVSEWWFYVGSQPGAYDILNTGNIGLDTQVYVGDLSQWYQSSSSTVTIYLKLWYRELGGRWKYIEQARSLIQSALDYPLPGSTLTSSTEIFEWLALDTHLRKAQTIVEYWLYIGTVAGTANIYNSGNLNQQIGINATGLPSDGSTIYARLWYRVDGNNWNFYDHEYQASNIGPTISITFPEPGSTLSSPTQSFSWNDISGSVTEWWLYAGSSLGGREYSDSRSLGTATSYTVDNLPSGTGSSTVFIRLWYRSGAGSAWLFLDEEYATAQ